MSQHIYFQKLKYTYLMLFVFLSSVATGQSVGVVLSGGGSSGLAHIGVLKALEENNIPIDYITGSSMGAVVGGLYSAGIEIDRIEKLFLSQAFQNAIDGEIESKNQYLFKRKDDDASWINLKTNKKEILRKIIPANVLSPVQMDLMLVELLSGPTAASNYCFDSLFVPYRCIASDVHSKEQVIFSDGELHQAIRASSTYPLFFRPIYYDNRLLFDGGIYNNFPADVMINEFNPDIIIGSNVASNAIEPNPDDLFNQLDNLISSPSSFEIPDGAGVLIEPETDTFVLDFSKAKENVYAGWQATLDKMSEIKNLIPRRVSKHELEIKRELFQESFKPLQFKDITVIDSKNKNLEYYKKLLRNEKGKALTLNKIKSNYYRIFQDDHVSYLFPNIRYDHKKEAYELYLKIYKEKEVELKFGGNISSRPVNMGYIGLKYNIDGKTPKSIALSSYFGKFYGSTNGKFRSDFILGKPVFLELEGTIQSWDYFESFSTFFEDNRPPFIIQEDRFVGATLGTPLSDNGLFEAHHRYGFVDNNYYQVDEFSPTDTSDVTRLTFNTPGITVRHNNLNRKQFPTVGHKTRLSASYILGKERTTPGSTGVIESEYSENHNWMTIRLDHEKYFFPKSKIKLGYMVTGVFSTAPLLRNYKSTVLLAPAFQPIPESKTIFEENFRAHQFGAIGGKVIWDLHKNIDFRLEGYVFQPYQAIIENEVKEVVYQDELEDQYYIGTATIVYHSPLGPVSFASNYYDKRDENFSFIFNIGYLIFNKRAF